MAFLSAPHQYTDQSSELLRRSNFGRVNWGLVVALAANVVLWMSVLAFAWRAIG